MCLGIAGTCWQGLFMFTLLGLKGACTELPCIQTSKREAMLIILSRKCRKLNGDWNFRWVKTDGRVQHKSKTDSLKSIFDVVQWATIKFATFLTGKHIIFISLNHVFGNAPFPHVGCKAKGTYWSNLRKRDWVYMHIWSAETHCPPHWLSVKAENGTQTSWFSILCLKKRLTDEKNILFKLFCINSKILMAAN